MIYDRLVSLHTDGQWSVSQAPDCIVGQCAPLDPPTFGEINCSDDNRVGSKCEFACNEGYEIFGDEVRICEDTHLWSGLKLKD